MRVCPGCGIETSAERCPTDGLVTLDAALLERKDPFLGRTIAGRYVVESHLGSGGMGAVYRARHRETGGMVALQVMRRDGGEDSDAVKRFSLEAQNAAVLSSAHSVRVLDFGADDETLFLVMELLDGEPLDVRLRRGALHFMRATAKTLVQISPKALLPGTTSTFGCGMEGRTSPIAIGAKAGGVWVATAGAGDAALVSRIDAQGIVDQRKAPLTPEFQPAGLAEHSDQQLALLTAHKIKLPELTVWGPDGNLRWKSAVSGISDKNLFSIDLSASFAVRPGPGAGFLVLGNFASSISGVALLQGGDTAPVMPNAVSMIGPMLVGRHDRLHVAWIESFFPPKQFVRVFDAFGNATCDASGPRWSKSLNDCDDKDPCTFDRCDAAHSGCWHSVLADGSWCGDGATCQTGVCVKKP